MGKTRWARDQSGFTLPEVLVTVLVLAILTTVAIASYRLSIESAMRTACRSNLRAWDSAVLQYRVEHGGDLPSSLEACRPHIAHKRTFAKCPKDDVTGYLLGPDGSIGCPIHGR